jgi:putative ABC transport system permease protein
MALLDAGKGAHQAAMTGGRVTVVPPQGPAGAFFADARYSTADFFAMFEVPFQAGNGWTAVEDEKSARVAVVTGELATRLYGTTDAVGRTLRLGKYDFRVIGVLRPWHPVPHFYDLGMGKYAEPEQVYLPLRTATDLKLGTQGSISCWGDGFPETGGLREADQCGWLQSWVQLDTPAQVAAYRGFLDDYSREQARLGRFARPPNVRLRNVQAWLDHKRVVPGSVQLQALLALGFMLVCLVNTVTLLLVKFMRRGPELSVRRAMGASRRAIFSQLLVEASVVGVSGGVVGLMLAALGLWIVRQQPAEYAGLAHLDAPMLSATLAVSVAATLLAALFPAWRACRIAPARLLKIQ